MRRVDRCSCSGLKRTMAGMCTMSGMTRLLLLLHLSVDALQEGQIAVDSQDAVCEELRVEMASLLNEAQLRSCSPLPSSLGEGSTTKEDETSHRTSTTARRYGSQPEGIQFTFAVQCFHANSSFDPLCNCLGRLQPAGFSSRPVIRIVAGSWCALDRRCVRSCCAPYLTL